jgi:hypothetical protein
MDEYDIPITKSLTLSYDDRKRHLYMLGKTGMGKSTLLENMVICDIENDAGVVFIDPHGTSAPNIIDNIPNHRIDDVVYLNLLDIEYPPALNQLHNVPKDDRHLIADGITTSCRYTWPDVWGEGRMEYLAYNTVAAILDMGDGNLHDCLRMYTDKTFRGKVINRITNPVVRSFWVNEFPENDRVRREWVAPVQNKIGQLFAAQPFRNILGQVKSTFDVKSIMDNQKIFIVNLAKGTMGYRSKLLGSFLLVQLYLAAMRRALEAQEIGAEPVPCYVYVDEAGTFPPDIFSDILSEARKGGLCLTLAHQYLSQLTEDVRDAVFGNVGTMVMFRIGQQDATIMGQQFPTLGDGATKFPPHLLSELGAHSVYIKFDGENTPEFFKGVTIPGRTFSAGSYKRVINQSRNRYAKPRHEVEQELQQRYGE